MENQFSGLVMHGTVINRHIKKNVGDDNKEYVTYTVEDNDGREYHIVEWEPDKENCYKKGEYVNINVYIKTYISNGNAKFGYYVKKENSGFLGEEF